MPDAARRKTIVYRSDKSGSVRARGPGKEGYARSPLNETRASVDLHFIPAHRCMLRRPLGTSATNQPTIYLPILNLNTILKRIEHLVLPCSSTASIEAIRKSQLFQYVFRKTRLSTSCHHTLKISINTFSSRVKNRHHQFSGSLMFVKIERRPLRTSLHSFITSYPVVAWTITR